MSEAQRNECPLDRLVIPHGGFRTIVADPPWMLSGLSAGRIGRTEKGKGEALTTQQCPLKKYAPCLFQK